MKSPGDGESPEDVQWNIGIEGLKISQLTRKDSLLVCVFFREKYALICFKNRKLKNLVKWLTSSFNVDRGTRKGILFCIKNSWKSVHERLSYTILFCIFSMEFLLVRFLLNDRQR